MSSLFPLRLLVLIGGHGARSDGVARCCLVDGLGASGQPVINNLKQGFSLKDLKIISINYYYYLFCLDIFPTMLWCVESGQSSGFCPEVTIHKDYSNILDCMNCAALWIKALYKRGPFICRFAVNGECESSVAEEGRGRSGEAAGGGGVISGTGAHSDPARRPPSAPCAPSRSSNRVPGRQGDGRCPLIRGVLSLAVSERLLKKLGFFSQRCAGVLLACWLPVYFETSWPRGLKNGDCAPCAE